MRVGVPRETAAGERRVALAPVALSALKKSKISVMIESGAGAAAGFSDETYKHAEAEIAETREQLFAACDVIAQVRALGANAAGWEADLTQMREGQTLIGLMDPLTSAEAVAAAAKRSINAFALELMPRITRAQSMDVLSSQANLAGYKAVLLAAAALPKVFPMMMTAAGTITPARVFVLGAGVAGLQAIATAKRLGAVVSGYDVRAAAKEQIESLGARCVQLPLEAAEGTGGYAAKMDEAFYKRQAELLSGVIAESDVVITTAAIPGQKAPILITRDMVEKMPAGGVVVDLAAERGGNCDATIPGQNVLVGGATVMGPLDLPSTLATHASQLYAKNMATFLVHLSTKEGELNIDTEDEITRETLVAHGGEVTSSRVRERLGA